VRKHLENKGFATRAIHLAKPDDASAHAISMGVTNRGAYARQTNPVVDALEEAIAALEGGVGAIAAASGMAAVSQTLLGLLPPGGRLVTHRCLYDWSTILRAEVLPHKAADIVAMDLRDLSELERSLRTPTTAVYLEPLSNPILDVLDLDAIVRLAHKAGALVIVDNTFLSPYLLRPLERGADVVLHAATKYLAGHGDVLAGIVTARDKSVLERLDRARSIYGGVLAPTSAYLVLRGLATLPLRLERHGANAMRLASYLTQHPKVARVVYPGLETDPGHAVATAQWGGFGGMMGLILRGGRPAAERLLEALCICRPWVSLGDVETLITVRDGDAERGITDGFLRVSVGLEDSDDLIEDFNRALAQV